MARQHGQAVTYRFGIDGGSDSRNGCRCEPCRQALAEYEKKRKQRTAPAYVTAGPAREHVAWLSTQGVGLKQIVKVSGVSQGTLWKLMYGKKTPRHPNGRLSKRIRRETHEAILAVTPSDGAAGSRVPAGPVWANVHTLLVRGWTKGAISAAIGQGGRTLQLGDTYITRGHADAIAALLGQPVPPRRGAGGPRAAVPVHHTPSEVDDDAQDDAETIAYNDAERLLIDMAELLEHNTDESWRRRAACRRPNVPAWIFFPARGDVRAVRAAKAVCAACPVAAECLAANGTERDGIYGGLTTRERRALRSSGDEEAA